MSKNCICFLFFFRGWNFKEFGKKQINVQINVFNMGHLVVLLENHFKNEGVPHLFTATSKLHGVAHAALWAEFVSRRLVWCFTRKDYMHHVQSLAQSCIAGTGPYLTVNKTVDKMRMALHKLVHQR